MMLNFFESAFERFCCWFILVFKHLNKASLISCMIQNWQFKALLLLYEIPSIKSILCLCLALGTLY